MVRSIVSREDTVYKAFPDIAMSSDGTLVCTFRESLGHGWHPFSRVAVQLSTDGGLNWGDKQIVAACEDVNRDGGFTGSRVISLGETRLLLGCEWVPPHHSQESPDIEVFLWESGDSGRTWRGPRRPGIRGRVSLSLNRMRSGTLILSTNTFDKTYGAWRHQAFLSTDLGSSWTEPRDVGFSPKLSLSEGAYVHLDDSSLVAYMREDKECICGYKSVSKDNGETWQGPYPTHLLACRGRPYGGLLRSGEVVVMYGFGTTPRQLVMHVETQQIAADPDCVQNSGQHSHLRPAIRRFFIDHDRSIHPDAAYPAWTQLADGDIFAVQYIVDDAPMGHIRSYRISRSDWLLYPEGRLGREDA